MDLVIEHGRRALQGLADEILADDDDRQTRRADVLLRPGVDETEARDVDGPGEDGGGHVRHQGHLTRVRDIGKLHPLDSLVGGVVDIGRRLAQQQVGLRRHAGEFAFVPALRDGDRAITLGLLDGLLRPGTGLDIIRVLGTPQQVHRHHGELTGGTALEEQHLIVLGDGQQGAQIGLGLGGDGHVLLAAVAHLRHTHAGAMPVQHLLPGLVENALRQHGRAGAEVIGSCHGGYSVKVRNWGR